MPQGSWLGLLCFVSLINDLHTTCLTHKFVDDTTLSEIILSKEQSNMQNHLNSVSKWSDSYLMKINWKKTKEMVIAPAKFKELCLPLNYNRFTIEQVSSFKLLGVSVNTALRWNDHTYHHNQSIQKVVFSKTAMPSGPLLRPSSSVL